MLLTAMYATSAPPELRKEAAVETLRQVWIQNFLVVDERLVWRENEHTPPTGRYIGSPYDGDARYATKRQTHWVGDTIHLTETYGDGQPNLITNVETTNAAVSDDAVTETIHAALAQRNLVPQKHVADTGYVNSPLFVRSKTTYGIDLVGPTRSDNHWQAKEAVGFAARDFAINWEKEEVVCPMGKVSNRWTEAIDKFKNEVIKIKFTTTDCQVCSSREKCTHSTPARRTRTLRRQAQHEALLAGRKREQSEQFKQEYAKRAGVEGTISQRVRTGKVRRARYFGQAKTHLQHLMTAAMMNIVRIVNWLAELPKAKTTYSSFAQLFHPAS